MTKRIVQLLAVAVLAAASGQANLLTGINYKLYGYGIGASTTSNSYDAIGVTIAGGTANPFLNDADPPAISLGPGDYLTFFEPGGWADTGTVLEIDYYFSSGHSYLHTPTLPDLSTAGNLIDTVSDGTVTVTVSTLERGMTPTSGGLVVDRMNTSGGSAGFSADGTNDTIFQLNVTDSAVPEPGSFLLMAAGIAATALWKRRRGSARSGRRAIPA